MAETISKLDLIFGKEPKQIQNKLVKLLLNYNAQMRYNKEEDQFQVNLLLPFDHPKRKQQFIEGFLHNRMVNQQPLPEQPNVHTQIEQLHFQQEVHKGNTIESQNKTKILQNIRFQQKEQEFKEIKTYNQKPKHGLDYQKFSKVIQNKLEEAFKSIRQKNNQIQIKLEQQKRINNRQQNKINDQLQNQDDKSEQIQKDFNPLISSNSQILILEQEDNEIKLFSSVQPKHIDYYKEEKKQKTKNENKKNQTPNRQTIKSIPTVQMRHQLKKKYTFEQYEQKYEQNKKKPNITKNRELIENRYNKFLKTHSRSLDKVYTQIQTQEAIVEVQQMEEFSEQEESAFRECVQSEYQKRITAVQQDMSAQQLVRYYKYLLNHARSLYLKHEKKKNK